jgi:hypothetical protein
MEEDTMTKPIAMKVNTRISDTAMTPEEWRMRVDLAAADKPTWTALIRSLNTRLD